MTGRRVPVLVVGGSLVGLSVSVLLAARGVRHVLVERHRGTAIHPRAAAFHQRTMEIFRQVGLQEQVEAAAAREFVQNGAIVAVESLAGAELRYFFSSFNDGVEHLSPTSRIFLTQVGLEPVLRKQAEALGAEHRFATELAGFEQRDDGVECVLRTRDGVEETVLADYVVAADGAHSPVRQRLGIDLLGPGTFADCVTIYFHADVRSLLGDRNLSVVYGGARAWFARHSARTCPWRSTTCSAGRPRPATPRPTAPGVCSWPATRRTSCRRPAGSAATRASPTRTTWRGSWR